MVNLDIRDTDQPHITSDDDFYCLQWGEFVLTRDEYKLNEKNFVMHATSTGQPMEISSRIRQSEQTDLELTFYSKACLLNYTDQNLTFFNSEGKKQILPCQNRYNNPVVPVSGHVSKVMAAIHDEGLLNQHVSMKWLS